jgi:hypothetical protein
MDKNQHATATSYPKKVQHLTVFLIDKKSIYLSFKKIKQISGDGIRHQTRHRNLVKKWISREPRKKLGCYCPFDEISSPQRFGNDIQLKPLTPLKS